MKDFNPELNRTDDINENEDIYEERLDEDGKNEDDGDEIDLEDFDFWGSDIHPTNITSNNLCDYSPGTYIEPDEKNKNAFNIYFQIVDSHTIRFAFQEWLFDHEWDTYNELITCSYFWSLLQSVIQEKKDNKDNIYYLDGFKFNEAFVTEYGAIIHCSKIDEAIEEILKLQEEIQNALAQKKQLVEDCLRKLL